MSKNNESRVIRALAGFLVLRTALREISRRLERSQPLPTPPPPTVQSSHPSPADPSTADEKLIRRSVIADGLIALGLAIAVFAATFWLEQRLDVRAEIRENLRFVRQSVMDNTAVKPFQGLNLAGATLVGLDLACQWPGGAPGGCANLRGADLSLATLAAANMTGADLSIADLRHTDLSGANLTRADLSDADLRGAALNDANLTGANLSADLRNAELSRADLNRADLRGATLTGANLTGAEMTTVCHDPTTVWPRALEPPPNRGAACAPITD